MADEAVADDDENKPNKKVGLLVGLVLALVGGSAAFAFTSGMIGGSDDTAIIKPAMLSDDLAFIPVEPMTVALGNPAERRFLRFRAELEVAASYEADITMLMPRVVDVLNTYLQSLSLEDIEDPSSLLTLRSQMRRRVDLVVGGDRIHDLLVMEFVVN